MIGFPNYKFNKIAGIWILKEGSPGADFAKVDVAAVLSLLAGLSLLAALLSAGSHCWRVLPLLAALLSASSLSAERVICPGEFALPGFS